MRPSVARRRGMIFPMILIMVFIFVLFVLVLNSFNTRNRQINYRDVMRRQSLYIAEAGMQHALLKLKILQADCFDALMISQLKNPRFNFGQDMNGDGKISEADIVSDPRNEKYNPGPIYITTSEAEREAMLADPKYSGDPADETPDGELKVFIRDFISDLSHEDEKTIKVTDKDSFHFRYGYEAKSVRILGVSWDADSKKGFISAEFIIEGWAWNKDGKKVSDTIKRSYKIEKQF